MAPTIQSQPAGCRIGAVAQLTSIPPDKLRVCERRHATLVTERSTNGGRLRATLDISRLALVKQLVDSGDSIGLVATLSLEALEARAAQAKLQTSTTPQNREPIQMPVVADS